MFCEMCGKQLEDTSKFCPYCGHKIFDGSSAEPTNYIEVMEGNPVGGFTESTDNTSQGGVGYQQTERSGHISQADSQPAKKKSGKAAIIAVSVIVLILGIAFGAFWYITDGELFESEIFNKEATQQSESGTTVQNVTGSASYEPLSPDIICEDEIYYVNIGSVTVYEGPDASVYKAAFGASEDDMLILKGTHSDYPEWLYVYSSYANDFGWIPEALVSKQKSTEAPTTDVNTNKEVIYYDSASRFDVMINVGEGHNLNLRRQPDTTDPENVIVLIPDKAQATVLGLSSKDTLWYYVEYTDEFATYYGYIHSDHVLRYY